MANQIQAKKEMAALVAEQAAKNANAVNQELPQAHPQAPGSVSDKGAQQTILSVIKSVLAMQSKDCNSVSEQLMAAGRSEEEVQNVSKIMAHTVRQLEAESSPPEPGPEARSLRAKKCRQTTSSLLENQTGVSMDIESQEAIKRSLPNAQTEKRLLAKK